jgi:hypothetical protein
MHRQDKSVIVVVKRYYCIRAGVKRHQEVNRCRRFGNGKEDTERERQRGTKFRAFTKIPTSAYPKPQSSSRDSLHSTRIEPMISF